MALRFFEPLRNEVRNLSSLLRRIRNDLTVGEDRPLVWRGRQTGKDVFMTEIFMTDHSQLRVPASDPNQSAQRVLIAVDETDASLEALNTAYEVFGRESNYSVLSLGDESTSALPSTALGGLAQIVLNGVNSMVDEGDDAGEDLVAEAASAIDANTLVEPPVGSAGVAICRVAQEQRSDVIVLGSHERSFWEKLFEPSLDDYVVDHAPCPVMVVLSES